MTRLTACTPFIGDISPGHTVFHCQANRADQWTKLMVASNDPEEMPVAVFSSRTPLKLPVAPSNRPVPPTMLAVPWIESSLGTPVGVACPLPVVVTVRCHEDRVSQCGSDSRRKVDQGPGRHCVSS
jgi:hypothetical protein